MMTRLTLLAWLSLVLVLLPTTATATAPSGYRAVRRTITDNQQELSFNAGVNPESIGGMNDSEADLAAAAELGLHRVWKRTLPGGVGEETIGPVSTLNPPSSLLEQASSSGLRTEMGAKQKAKSKARFVVIIGVGIGAWLASTAVAGTAAAVGGAAVAAGGAAVAAGSAVGGAVVGGVAAANVAAAAVGGLSGVGAIIGGVSATVKVGGATHNVLMAKKHVKVSPGRAARERGSGREI